MIAPLRQASAPGLCLRAGDPLSGNEVLHAESCPEAFRIELQYALRSQGGRRKDIGCAGFISVGRLRYVGGRSST
jgi:hypothetical protein